MATKTNQNTKGLILIGILILFSIVVWVSTFIIPSPQQALHNDLKTLRTITNTAVFNSLDTIYTSPFDKLKKLAIQKAVRSNLYEVACAHGQRGKRLNIACFIDPQHTPPTIWFGAYNNHGQLIDSAEVTNRTLKK